MYSSAGTDSLLKFYRSEGGIANESRAAYIEQSAGHCCVHKTQAQEQTSLLVRKFHQRRFGT
jgi:hypothetical protein